MVGVALVLFDFGSTFAATAAETEERETAV
jgi:hypothetical protein